MASLHFKDKTISIDNFRYFHQVSSNEIRLVIENFAIYLIKGLSVNDIYELSKNNKDKQVESLDFLGFTLPCNLCNGQGYIDWITNVTETPEKFTSTNTTFDRDLTLDPSTVMCSTLNGINQYLVHYSKVKLPKGSIYCKWCLGSGCNFLTNRTKGGRRNEQCKM